MKRKHWESLGLVLLAIHLVSGSIAFSASFITTGGVSHGRSSETATLLPNGQVLSAGGSSGSATSSAELYDPVAGLWTTTASMSVGRETHTATLLRNGKVLVAGGDTSPASRTAELFDPVTKKWTSAGSMTTNHTLHTATLLRDGRVLIAGGRPTGIGNSLVANAELYDPTTGLWTATGTMGTNRNGHTATLLPDGRVLVAGGVSSPGSGAEAEIYDPAGGSWTPAAPMNVGRRSHRAVLLPNGTVLVSGGFSGSSLSSAEIYDPASGTWTLTNSMSTARSQHSASLLPNGQVLVTGGGASISSAELYDPISGTWTATASMQASHQTHAAVVLANGRVLIDASSSGVFSQLYDYAVGSWLPGPSLLTARGDHTATLLPNGKVLVAGGYNTNNGYLGSVELFDPSTSVWTNTGSLNQARNSHKAVLLPNGKVLIVAGYDGTNRLASCELYDPLSETWTFTGSLSTARWFHTITLLSNGKVLVAGGADNPVRLASAEIYDPATEKWTLTSPMNFARDFHTATLLPDGRVLVAGTEYPNDRTCEIYNPGTGQWSNTGSMGNGRAYHKATLLPNGLVLVSAGFSVVGISSFLSSAEVYNPASGIWQSTASMTGVHYHQTSTLLLDGRVLIAGGSSNSGATNRTDIYDPLAPSFSGWKAGPPLTDRRTFHTATLLQDGRVLVAGGSLGSGGASLASVEIYDSGYGFDPAWQPQISAATLPTSYGSLTISGSGFTGISEASGGSSQNAASDHPVAQLRNLESGVMAFPLAASWSSNSFVSTPLTSFPPGNAMVTVFVNGIPSTGVVVSVAVPVPGPVILTNVQRLTNGAFQFAFTNTPGALFGVLATTNPALPLSNWTGLGYPAEVAPGQFQFTDPQAATGVQRFYCVRIP